MPGSTAIPLLAGWAGRDVGEKYDEAGIGGTSNSLCVLCGEFGLCFPMTRDVGGPEAPSLCHERVFVFVLALLLAFCFFTFLFFTFLSPN
jgi:hypothetical protein